MSGKESIEGSRTFHSMPTEDGFAGACTGGRWGGPRATSRSSRRLPSSPTGAVFVRADPGTRPIRACVLGERRTRASRHFCERGDTVLLNSCGGVTAALKRAVGPQPAAKGWSFQVVTGGELTWQSLRLMEARFGSA